MTACQWSNSARKPCVCVLPFSRTISPYRAIVRVPKLAPKNKLVVIKRKKVFKIYYLSLGRWQFSLNSAQLGIFLRKQQTRKQWSQGGERCLFTCRQYCACVYACPGASMLACVGFLLSLPVPAASAVFHCHHSPHCSEKCMRQRSSQCNEKWTKT